MEKRQRLSQTGSHIRLTGSIEAVKPVDFDAIAEKCMALTRERSTEIISFPQHREFEAEETPVETWHGKPRGIPKLYADCSLETYRGNDRLITALRECRTDGIVLRGPTGCGKTHLAIAIIRDNGVFITVPDLLLKIRSSFQGGGETEEEIIRHYSSLPTLVLDDFGAEKTSEFAITTLYIILDRRIRDCRRTIITTNLTQDQIEETFGARIASRLAGMENIKINMPDHRKRR